MKVSLVAKGLPCCGPKKNNLNSSNNTVSNFQNFGAVAEVARPIATVAASQADAAANFARSQVRLDAKFRAIVKSAKHSDGTPRFPQEVSFNNRQYFLTPEHEHALNLILGKMTPAGEFWIKEEDDIHRTLRNVDAKTLPILESSLRLIGHEDKPHEVAAILWNAKNKDLSKVVQGLKSVSDGRSNLYQLGLRLSGS